ncbi:hypothetical protein KI387_019475, partial [Taxus chinensis]
HFCAAIPLGYKPGAFSFRFDSAAEGAKIREWQHKTTIAGRSMEHVPSLLCLSNKALISLVNNDVHQWKKYLDQLPLDLAGDVLMNLTPIALQEVQQYMLGTSCECASVEQNIAKTRKRARAKGYEGLSHKRISILRNSENIGLPNENKTSHEEEKGMNLHACFNNAWKDRFKTRWPEGVKKTGYLSLFTDEDTDCKCEHTFYKKDWQQSYWEAHLQDCLREAAAQALVPSFKGSIGQIFLSDTIHGHMGIKHDFTCTRKDFMTLKHHGKRFGHYVRHLRLRNVLCVEEICDLLKSCKLQGIVFDGIKSKKHIEGTYQILKQNRETLEAVELFHCRISAADLSEICAALKSEGSSVNRIHFFSLTSSRVLINNDHTYFHGFLQFLSASRYLRSLKFSDNGFESTTAASIFTALFQSESGLSVLELCDNKLSGWLSWDLVNSPHFSSLPRNEKYFLRSLAALNLRGNLLERHDVDILKKILECMPQLQKLDLSDNPIGDDGVRILIPYFQDISKSDMSLVDVNIANCNISCVGASLLFDSLSILKKSLHSLGIAHNDLGSSVATSLAKFLRNVHTECLDIEGIGLGSSGCNQLQEVVSCNKSLVYLNLSKNRGGLAAATLLSNIISHSHKISVIDASYNILCLESLKLIATGLKQSK